MSTVVMAACRPLQMPPTAKSVLMAIADEANHSGYCWVSIPRICESTCYGRTAVIEAIKWLEQAGHVAADRSNGRHTKYQIIPQGRDLFAPAQPVREADQSAKQTGAQSGHNQSAWRTRPVRQADSTRKDRKDLREREARAQGDDQLPDGVDPDRWQAYREQAEHDGKLSAPRVMLAIGQLRSLSAAGIDCNAVLDAAVMRGLRDLADVARRLASEAAPQQARAGPGRVPASRTLQAFGALDEVTDRVTTTTARLADSRAARWPEKAALPEPGKPTVR